LDSVNPKIYLNQISLLGKFLKEMAKEKNLSFLKNHSFEREEISLIARSFGECLTNELKKELSQTPYSLIVDNCTVAKKNIMQ